MTGQNVSFEVKSSFTTRQRKKQRQGAVEEAATPTQQLKKVTDTEIIPHPLRDIAFEDLPCQGNQSDPFTDLMSVFWFLIVMRRSIYTRVIRIIR